MKVTPELDRRFRDAAVAAGDLDVGYDFVDSPIGDLFVAATPAGLCRISYDPEPDRLVESLARTAGVRVLRAPRAVDETRRELDEYFGHRRTRFDVAIDLRIEEGFSRRVLDELALVPYGEVTTYGELARRAEHPRAARAVGTIMNRNPIPIVLPCHRVVGASGALTGYAGGLERKEVLLRLEGALP
jgi:methylated-DNA-[protein]-cysteine S-methyltransferase